MTVHLFTATRLYELPSGEEALTGLCLKCGRVHSLLARVARPKDTVEVEFGILEPEDARFMKDTEAAVRLELEMDQVELEAVKIELEDDRNDSELLEQLRQHIPQEWR